jgi:UDP-2,4-diacetamido-2,4,6-trideoxy-beta-L-altropyranose hydrolase
MSQRFQTSELIDQAETIKIGRMLIRVDASVTIGAGHVMRCLALAQAWHDRGGDTCFVSALLSSSLQERIATEGFEYIPVNSPAGNQQDASVLLSLAEHRDTQVLILDGYHFDAKYQATIANCSSTTLTIDDDGRLPVYSSSFVLNQNPGVSEETYPNISKHTRLLLGSQYALLRREFQQSHYKAPLVSISKKVFRCLVTLGGSDPDNITAVAIQGLMLLQDEDMEVRVIIGGLNPHTKKLVELTSRDKRFVLVRNVSDMSKEYAWADFAIAAGGSSNWELCYYGLPRVVVVLADNQRSISKHLESVGIAINIGELADVSPSRIASAVNEFRRDNERLSFARKRAREIVDGFGAMRVVDQLLLASTLSPS